MDIHKLSERGAAKLARCSPSTITHFLRGRTASLTSKTYTNLAEGLAEKIGREMTVGQLRGEEPIAIEVPVRSYVGAGDEIFPFEDDAPAIEYVTAPPGLDDAEASIVRGRSMVPAYHDGDVIFARRMAIDPLSLRDEVVVMETKTGKRFLKLILPGTRKGRFHLVSINPSHPPIEDQQLAWVAPIVWVRKKQRR